MERMLVAFEAPDCMTAEAHEQKWDRWISDLASRGLQLVNDLDPVATVSGGSDIEIYEAVALRD